MLEEVEAIKNLEELVTVDGVDVFFIGSGDLSQSMGYPGQQTHPEVQALMEEGVTLIRESGKVAGVSRPDSYVPKFLHMGVQYFQQQRWQPDSGFKRKVSLGDEGGGRLGQTLAPLPPGTQGYAFDAEQPT